jgi:hypothetical protein
VRVSIEYENER